ncbi:TIGR01244 family sulfur transferase [Prosthecobacter sp.]|uniref:TIGR01244 family sulfur transferase n=1 Tax=Prosthecobacter sp. TaxID=1965333 RepID=UPI00248735E8|nr:TIGR01244 family sulfur transferase [Prosthecobacter sp.]MDI1313457.1 TIGR01244 family sulfur transferase [Prosthecobacter sp.]
MHYLKLFGLTVVCTMTVALGYFYLQRRHEDSLQPKLTRITDQVFLTSQLKPGDMRFLRQQQIQTVIDMRPDGEVTDQPSSEEIQRAAKASGMEFHYIPVPHDKIPDEAVGSLQSVLRDIDKPAVLYCRTGRRAVRLYALAKASQTDGPHADEILGLARSAGFDAEDLAGEIAQRIAHRDKPQPGQRQ